MTVAEAGYERRHARPGRVVLAGVTIVLSLLAAACGSTGSSDRVSGQSPAREAAAKTPRNGGSVVIGVPTESDSFNPVVAEWAASGSLVASSVMEPLAKLNARGGADPFLATSWIADSTFDRWLIHLRPDVKFSDGERFDATAVKLNLDTYVGGALTGQILQPMGTTVAVIDPLTVSVSFNQPWAAFPSSYLDGAGAMMMAPAMIHSKAGGAAHPIGTGPFVFNSWTPGGTFVVSRNPTYWRKGLPHLDQITFKVITDEPTAVAALRTGDVNMILSTNARDADRLASSYTVVKDWDSETASVLSNTAPSINGVANPLSNIHARRALAYATDRAALAHQVGAGVETASSPFAPTSVWGLPDRENGYVNHDPAKARQELAAYEHDTGQKSLDFTLSAVADVDTQRNVQILQDQWAKLGIHAHIETSDEPSLIRQLVAADYQTVLLNSYSYPDPDTSRVFWSSSTVKGVGQVNINFSLYANAQIDKDLTEGRVQGFPSQRKTAYDDLVHQVNAAVLNVWLYRTPYSFIAGHRLQGLDTARTVAFGNFEPKVWLGDLWLADN